MKRCQIIANFLGAKLKINLNQNLCSADYCLQHGAVAQFNTVEATFGKSNFATLE
jgi:hypothetical protein